MNKSHNATALLGLLAGIVHHVVLQYPKQKSLFATIAGFASLEIAFAALLLNRHNSSFLSILPFTAIYVRSLRALLIPRWRRRLSVRRYIMSTFVIEAFPASSGFVPQTGDFTKCITARLRTR